MQLTLEPTRSLLLLYWLLSLYGLASVACLVYLPAPWHLVAALSVMLMWVFALRQHFFRRGGRVVTRLTLDGDSWRLVGNDWRCDARLQSCTVWPALVVLRLRCDTERRSRYALIMRDAVPPGQFAQLRTAARFAPVSR